MDLPNLTESPNPRTSDIDLLSSPELIQLLLSEQLRGLQAVVATSSGCAHLVDAVVARLRDGGRLIYLGAGTSGRLAEADLAELPATFGFEAKRLAVVRPSNAVAEDDRAGAVAALSLLQPNSADVAIGISASGRTPWVVSGLDFCRTKGTLTGAIVNNRRSEVAALADYRIEIDTGPEPITGSTRMSAGLAQKLILSTLSTAVMVQLGLTYGNLMTRATGNLDKLDQRRVSIVATVTRVDQRRAEDLLRSSNGEVETAILSHMRGQDAASARSFLEKEGSLRQALDSQ